MSGWRITVLLLLLANLAFFAWARYLSPAGASSETYLLQQQLKPEAIHLVPPQEAAALATRLACVEWGGFSADAVARAQETLGKLLPDVKYGQRQGEEASTWWVFVPAAASRQAAQQKVAELRKLGVSDLFIVQEEGFRNAISLGVFRSQEAARNRLEQLRASGVRSAQVGPREGQMELTWLQLQNLPADSNARLAELKRAQPGSDVKTCAAAAKS